jgi:hypothetical protein
MKRRWLTCACGRGVFTSFDVCGSCRAQGAAARLRAPRSPKPEPEPNDAGVRMLVEERNRLQSLVAQARSFPMRLPDRETPLMGRRR